MQSAVKHAEIYCNLIENHQECETLAENRKNAHAQSHQNVGMLHELLGNYKDALKHYDRLFLAVFIVNKILLMLNVKRKKMDRDRQFQCKIKILLFPSVVNKFYKFLFT
jgi:hypothetical protein